MTQRSKALLVIFVLAALFAGGLLVIVVGGRLMARHIPSEAVLTLDLKGEIPQRPPDSPFASLFGEPPTSLIDVRDALVNAAKDERIKVVRVRVGDLAAGFATLQEIRSLLVAAGEAGKDTVAYLETAGEFAPGNQTYYLASGCGRIVLNPMGDVNLIGMASRTPFIRGTLDKLGIVPEFPGIGDYKTARFMYTETDMTSEQKEMTTWLLTSLTDILAEAIAESRGLEPGQVRTLIDNGPYIGRAAVDAKLVDAMQTWPEFVDAVRGGVNGGREEISLKRYLRAGRPDRSGTPIAVVMAEGGIMRGESGYSPVPLLGGDVMGSDTIARAFRDVRDSNAKAVVFRINSPGGSAIASELIRNEMTRTAEKIPVVVSMSDVAASGGYWITCGAKKIVAEPSTITASIGVFGGHMDMRKFWNEKLGVTFGSVDLAPNAAMYSSLDEWTEDQRKIVMKSLDRIYDAFVERVAESRGMTPEQVDAIGRGRVFTGVQAKERGLVDELGGLDQAIDEARALAGLAADADVELVFYPRQRTLFEQLMQAGDARARAKATERLLEQAAMGPGPVWLPPIDIR